MRFGGSFCFIYKSLLGLLFFYFFGIAKAQNRDTTLLDEVTVKTTKLNSSITGKKLQKIDSLSLEIFKNQTLDVLLR